MAPIDYAGIVRRALAAHGIRQADLAAAMGVHPTRISNLLSGREPMKLHMLMRIEEATGLVFDLPLLLEDDRGGDD